MHFYAVGFTALAAAAACVALSVVGARFDDRRIPEMNGVIMFTGGATLPADAALLAPSSFGVRPLKLGVRPLLYLEAVLLAAILGLGVSAIFSPDLVPYIPAANSPAALATLNASLLIFFLLGARALRTFLLTGASPTSLS